MQHLHVATEQIAPAYPPSLRHSGSTADDRHHSPRGRRLPPPLADWYREAAAEAGTPLDKEQARERIYGMPFAEWKARHQREATPEQLAAFKAAQERHG